MVSNEQRAKMLMRLRVILDVIHSCRNIAEVSKKTDISTSVIQRYLNNKEMLMELFGDTKMAEACYEKNQLWLREAKMVGNRNGGVISQKKHGYAKVKGGKFNGSGTLEG